MAPGPPQPSYPAWAAAAARALQRWYRPARGLWQGAGWWQSANALTALIRYTQVTGDRAHAGAVATTFRRAPRWRRGFANRFYDDNGWWALAWVAAFDLDGDPRYLAAAARLFARNAGGWDGTCGGGLWWNTSRRYKNAITTELFLTLAARLSLRTADPGGRYRDWARRAGDWFLASGMIGPDGLVNDGLTAGCGNNGRTTWTYNQGVILSGLADLYRLTGDPGYLDAGHRIAGAALSALTTPAGILAEPSERPGPARYGDDTQFKGVFARGLHDFSAAGGRPAYREFILRNARTLWEHGRGPGNEFGMCWSGPPGPSGASLQSSALDLLNAAAALSRRAG